ncbi:GGDEF/EAL domain-containing response regulator [Desulfobacter curvatus]|uniref:GGDEF/EAL domain-containing response regulator n=1 Tax=Desulfobacter curvatus TaxID=2290 RepID=UPI00036A1A39|nr:EAL domain-containing protein [Desulfobacter curvatus]
MNIQEKKSSYRIIVIDDNAAIHEDFRKILGKASETNSELEDMESLLFDDQTTDKTPDNHVKFEIEYAFQGQEGFDMVHKANEAGNPFSLAFVDGRMPPGWDGIETISHLWEAAPELQVVLCTAYADYSWPEIQKVLGESDSLLILKKPFDNVEVLQMAHALTRKWELNREIKGRLNKLAFYDNLTGLPNRALFLDRLNGLINQHLRDQQRGALLFIDLDDFKRINDTLGHSVGDELLQIMAARLVKSLRLSDTVSRSVKERTAARLGGDEFTVLLPEIDDLDKAAVVSQRIVENVSKPVSIGKNEFMVTPSIGIAIFPDDGDTVETLLKNADLAMYFAKRSNGQGNFKYYQESMNDTALKRLTIESQLRQAIDRDEMHLFYQPQVDLPSGELIGMEALLRWDNHVLGSVSPVEFIPIAEACGLIIPIGEWVMRTACTQMNKWMKNGLSVKRVAVNVSVKQFTHPDFLSVVETILEETGMAAKHLEIEITESHFAGDMDKVSYILNALRDKGIGVSVDDFGTGYSSLSRLKDLPIDCLKIDRSFVLGVDSRKNDQSIIAAIMSMAKGMDIRVVAEGIDNDRQLDFLMKKECVEAQGFLFSRPLPAKAIEAILKKGGRKIIFPRKDD